MGQETEPAKSASDSSITLERLKAWLDFWKFIGASVVAAIVVVAIPPFFQLATARLESARKLLELDQSKITFHDTYVKDFVEKALNQDIEIRMRLARYFADVSDEEYKKDWESYLDHITKLRDAVREDINKKERQLSSLQFDTSGDPIEIAELKRELAWKYGELGYSASDRDVVADPRSSQNKAFNLVSSPDKTMIDFLHPINSADAQCLSDHSIKYVTRFYRRGNSALNLMEAKLLQSNGIRIVAATSGYLSKDDLSLSYGISEATRIFSAAQATGQPNGTPIFFDIEFDANDTDIQTKLIPFFTGIKQVNEKEANQSFRIGAYGSGLILKKLREAKLIDFGWLTGAIGFRGTAEAIAAGDWDIRQSEMDTQGPCGDRVDQNIISSKTDGDTLSFVPNKN